MLKVEWVARPGASLRVLCLGAHADDIELGCGAALMELIQNSPEISFYWVVFSACGERRDEAEASAKTLLQDSTAHRIRLESFPDGRFPYDGGELKSVFEELKQEVTPDLILTHHRGDLHQDHRIVSELTWNTFRDHMILEYEIPKYDADLGAPNVFMPVSRETCERKARHLIKHFPSQHKKHWFTEDTFLALPRIRGVESRATTGYAEAFHARKLTFELGGAR